MPVNLGGIIFSQVYTDNSGGPAPEFDSDGDGVASQEDEFVAISSVSGTPVDISGWQIWSDSTGSGAPDTPVDGLYHTFAPGTVLANGEQLAVINEISAGGSVPFTAVEASEGGVESGAGGVSTNLLTEGDGGSASESIVLLNPVTGEYIVFNFGPDPFDFSDISGFPGTTNVGEVDAEAVHSDPGTGFSVQYDSSTDAYVLDTVFVPCFTRGTRISLLGGTKQVEDLKVGDVLITQGGGTEKVKAVLTHEIDLRTPKNEKHKPVLLQAGCFGPDRPARALLVSPQHRILMREDATGELVLVPAKALIARSGVRVANGKRSITYFQIVCAQHSVISSEAFWTESFFLGRYSLSVCDAESRQDLFRVFPGLREGILPRSAYPMLTVGAALSRNLSPYLSGRDQDGTMSRAG